MPRARTTVGISAAVLLAVTTATPYIEKFEGERHVPYRDITGVLTVCDGHTGHDVVVNRVYDNKQCFALTEADATKAAQGVLSKSPGLAEHPMQLAAAISFTYNVGLGVYNKSSIATDFNAGRLKQGCTDLLKYVYAGGQYSQGIYNRRKQEYAICMKGL
jgi:lysozyme